MVTQLSEDTDRALGVEEADVQTFSPLTRLLVDQLDTLISELFAALRQRLGTAKAMWWIPSPRFSMNFAMVLSGEVASSSSIFV